MLSNIFYKLVSFADYSNLEHTEENIKMLESLSEDKNYSFNVLNEIRRFDDVFHGIQIVDDEGVLNVNIVSGRIEIVRFSDKLEGFKEDELVDIRKQIVETFVDLNNCFEEKIQLSNRLAWVTKYVYHDINEDEMDSFRNRFLNKINYYDGKQTTEFVARYAGVDECVISEKNEKLNVISTIDRWFPGSGDGFVKRVNGYGIEIDINTLASIKKNRFDNKNCLDFVLESDSIRKCVIGGIMNGGS